MILTCPNCQTKFQLESERLGDLGSKVRCSVCSHEWFQEAEEDYDESEDDLSDAQDIEELEDEADVAGESGEGADKEFVPNVVIEEAPPKETVSKRVNASEPKSDNSKKMMALSAVCFVLMLSFLWLGKSFITGVWPQSANVYALFEAKGDEYQIGPNDIAFERFLMSHNGDELRVDGLILNLTPNDIEIPALALDILDESDSVTDQIVLPIASFTVPAESEYKLSKNLLIETSPKSAILKVVDQTTLTDK